jgi:hypothetical protein
MHASTSQSGVVGQSNILPLETVQLKGGSLMIEVSSESSSFNKWKKGGKSVIKKLFIIAAFGLAGVSTALAQIAEGWVPAEKANEGVELAQKYHQPIAFLHFDSACDCSLHWRQMRKFETLPLLKGFIRIYVDHDVTACDVANHAVRKFRSEMRKRGDIYIPYVILSDPFGQPLEWLPYKVSHSEAVQRLRKAAKAWGKPVPIARMKSMWQKLEKAEEVGDDPCRAAVLLKSVERGLKDVPKSQLAKKYEEISDKVLLCGKKEAEKAIAFYRGGDENEKKKAAMEIRKLAIAFRGSDFGDRLKERYDAIKEGKEPEPLPEQDLLFEDDGEEDEEEEEEEEKEALSKR